MLNVDEVKKIAKIKTKKRDNLILTVYLNTDRSVDQKEKYFMVLKDMAKKIKIAERENPNLNKDWNKIENFLKYKFSKKAKGLFILSCIPEKIWNLNELQISLPNLSFADRNPYVKPLVNILEDYQKYCLILVSKDKARIFTVYLGKIVEHFDVFDVVVGKHKKGGSSEGRFQRHHEDEVHRHLKKVAEKLFFFFKKEKFNRIIIGSTSEVLPEFEKVIHPWLRERVAGKFHTELFANANKLLKESLKIEEQIERNEENYRLAQLKNNLGPKKYAVSGLDDTLFELQEGRLNLLIIKKAFKASGRECIECNYIDAWKGKKCPICREETRKINDIIERAIEIAFEKNVKIEFVEGDNEFEKLGNIGGLLRY
jgi:peptide chain release factor subunit 1